MKLSNFIKYILAIVGLFLCSTIIVKAEDIELIYPQSRNLPNNYTFCESNNDNAVKVTHISGEGVVTITATGLGRADIRCSSDYGDVYYHVTSVEQRNDSSSSGSSSSGGSSGDNYNTSNNDLDIGYDNSKDEAQPCKFILGSVNDSHSFAYFLNQIFKLIKVVGPLLAVIMTIVDAVKAVTNQDKDTMGKFVNKTIKRVIYAVLLFVVPSLLDFVFRLVGIYGVCNIGLK